MKDCSPRFQLGSQSRLISPWINPGALRRFFGNFSEASLCHSLSEHWYTYCQGQLSATSLQWMRQLPHVALFSFGGVKHALVHGSWTRTAEFIFPSTDPVKKLEECQKADVDTILSGHSGIPFMQSLDKRYTWINTGALGMPADDATARVWALLVEQMDQGICYQLLPIEYDAHIEVDRMRKAGLPIEYQKSLITGKWCDDLILPEEEKSHRFIPLKF